MGLLSEGQKRMKKYKFLSLLKLKFCGKFFFFDCGFYLWIKNISFGIDSILCGICKRGFKRARNKKFEALSETSRLLLQRAFGKVSIKAVKYPEYTSAWFDCKWKWQTVANKIYYLFQSLRISSPSNFLMCSANSNNELLTKNQQTVTVSILSSDSSIENVWNSSKIQTLIFHHSCRNQFPTLNTSKRTWQRESLWRVKTILENQTEHYCSTNF